MSVDRWLPIWETILPRHHDTGRGVAQRFAAMHGPDASVSWWGHQVWQFHVLGCRYARESYRMDRAEEPDGRHRFTVSRWEANITRKAD